MFGIGSKRYRKGQKVKKAKLQTFRGKFEQIRMNGDENIVVYFLQADEVVNTIEGLGEPIEIKVIVWKILRTLPMRFDAKVSLLEEISDLENVNLDKLHEILTTYEMRKVQDNSSKREAYFTTSKKARKKTTI